VADERRSGAKTAKNQKEGITVLKKKKRQKPKSSGSCFVLMPFKEPFDTYFTMIFEPAVLASNLRPRRGDSLFRPSPIMADIWQMIQEAKVLVAELTEKNANVFYELGLAHALGKPVILVSETIVDVPFDLQPLRVILYNKSDPAWGVKLKDDIVSSLGETLQDVTQAVPPMFRKIVKSQAPQDTDLSVRLSELERRMASLSSSTSLFDSERSRRHDNLNWSAVGATLLDAKKLRNRWFESRTHAVAWTIHQLAKYPAATVRKQLMKRLHESEEAQRVFDLALSAPEPVTRMVSRSVIG
jgi:hypothetical protein